MVWVYDRTQSLLVAMLMHLSLTASLLILNPLAIAGAHLVVYSFALAGAMWIVVAAVAREGWLAPLAATAPKAGCVRCNRNWSQRTVESSTPHD